MVFQWFWQSWTITIECFLGGPTIGTNGFSMVFKILRAMVNNGLFYPLWSIFSPLWSIFNLIWTLFEKTPFLALVNEFCLGQNDLLYVLKRPLQIFNGFWGDHHHWMFLGGLTIAINGFTMVFWCCYHRFQWFSMVPDHWSNDAMVSMDRCGLTGCNNKWLGSTSTSQPEEWVCQSWVSKKVGVKVTFTIIYAL